jgi:PAS domain S-box-containing protein
MSLKRKFVKDLQSVNYTYQDIFNSSPISTIILDLNGTILEANNAALALFQYSEAELLKLSYVDFVPERFKELAGQGWDRLIKKGFQNSIHLGRKKNNSEAIIHYKCSVKEERNIVIAVINEVDRDSKAARHLQDFSGIDETGDLAPIKKLINTIICQNERITSKFESEEYYRGLLEHAPVPIIEFDYSTVKKSLDKLILKEGELTVDYFKERPELCFKLLFKRILRYSNKAGDKILLSEDVNTQQKLENVKLAYMSKSPEFLVMLVNNGKQFEFKEDLYRKDGSIFNSRVRISTNSDDYSKVFYICEDITEMRKAHDELEQRAKMRTNELEKANEKLSQSESRYKHLEAIYPVGIFHTDDEGNTIYQNSKVVELQGELNDDDPPFSWAQNIHPDDRGTVISTWENAVTYRIPVNIDYRFVHGEKITWINGKTEPEYDENGLLVGFVGALADITKQREAEERNKTNQNHIQYVERLNSMGEVASGIAHELNQPLTAIMNYTSGCTRRLKELEDKPPKDIVNAIISANVQAQRAGKIINNLKDFLSKGVLNKERIDINESIKESLEFIKKSGEREKVTIKLNLKESLPSVVVDKIHIEQVIINIVNNAIDELLESKTKKPLVIIYSSLYNKKQLSIRIEDNGRGIPDELIESIFNPFVTGKQEGMGIGLTLCYKIIDRHDGKISVSSEQGKGSVFNILLPIK